MTTKNPNSQLPRTPTATGSILSSYDKDAYKGIVNVLPNDAGNDAIAVSYQDDYNAWQFMETPLKQHLGLLNGGRTRIELFKTSTEYAPRTIDTKLQFLPSNARSFEYAVSPINRYLKASVHLFLVYCEDMEVYKKQVKPRIRTWSQEMTDENKEWFVVSISLGAKSASITDKFKSFATKYTGNINVNMSAALQKLQNPQQQTDRFFNLRVVENDPKNEQIWSDFINKLKESIAKFTEEVITDYEAEVVKQDAQRMLPTFNYCSFFLYKEGLAFAFERAGLLNEALKQYYELEVLFMENIDTKRKLDRFGCTDPGDDNAVLLETSKKKYRLLIHQNAISEFDLRHYIFARQSKLLLALDRPVRVLKNAIVYIQHMSVDIAAYAKVSRNFLACWKFSACLGVAKACEKYSASQKLFFLLAELYNTARAKLETLGQATHLLPYKNVLFPCDKFNYKAQSEVTNSHSVSKMQPMDFYVGNDQLRVALESETEFDKLYLELALQSLAHYQDAARFRYVLNLNVEIAKLHFKRGNWREAESLYKSLYTSYVTEGWYQFVYSIRASLAECQRQLKHDLEYVGTCVELLNPLLKVTREEQRFYIEEMKAVSKTLPQNLSYEMSAIIRPVVRVTRHSVPLGEPVTVECVLFSELLHELHVDALIVKFAEGQKIFKITLQNVTIPPGKSIFNLNEEASIIGEYCVERVIVQIGQLSLSYTMFPEEDLKVSVTVSSPSVWLDIPNKEHLIMGIPQYFKVRIHTKTDRVLFGNIKISSKVNVINQSVLPAKLIDEGSQGVSTSEITVERNSVAIQTLEKHQILEFVVPVQFTDGTYSSIQKVNIDFSYRKHTQEEFTVSHTMGILFTSPFSLNFNYVHLPNSIFLHILLQSQVDFHLEVFKSVLNLPRPYTISKNIGFKTLDVFPHQSASLVYEISSNGISIDEENSFDLELVYRVPSQIKENLSFVLSHVPYSQRFPPPSHVDFQVEIKFPETAIAGTIVPIDFVIFSTFEKTCKLEIDFDPFLWGMMGIKKQVIEFKSGEKKVVSKNLLPISMGMLPVPQIRMEGVSSSKIITNAKSTQIVVVPNPFFASPVQYTELT